jgi:hypothetical protein
MIISAPEDARPSLNHETGVFTLYIPSAVPGKQGHTVFSTPDIYSFQREDVSVTSEDSLE